MFFVGLALDTGLPVCAGPFFFTFILIFSLEKNHVFVLFHSCPASALPSLLFNLVLFIIIQWPFTYLLFFAVLVIEPKTLSMPDEHCHGAREDIRVTQKGWLASSFWVPNCGCFSWCVLSENVCPMVCERKREVSLRSALPTKSASWKLDCACMRVWDLLLNNGGLLFLPWKTQKPVQPTQQAAGQCTMW